VPGPSASSRPPPSTVLVAASLASGVVGLLNATVVTPLVGTTGVVNPGVVVPLVGVVGVVKAGVVVPLVGTTGVLIVTTDEVAGDGADSPTLAVLSVPTVSANVVVPVLVPSDTTMSVALAVNTELLLKFVVDPMFPISLRMF